MVQKVCCCFDSFWPHILWQRSLDANAVTFCNYHPPRMFCRTILFWRAWCRGFKFKFFIHAPVIEELSKCSFAINLKTIYFLVKLSFNEGIKFLKDLE